GPETNPGLTLALDDEVDEVSEYVGRYRCNLRAATSYIGHSIQVPLHLIVAEDAPGAAAYRNWDEILPADLIKRTSSPGTHQTIMEQPHIALLGATLTAAMRREQSTRSQVQKSTCPIVSIRDAQSGATPVICLPGAGGSAISFLDLAGGLETLGAIEAVQPRGIDGKQVPHSTVTAAAKK